MGVDDDQILTTDIKVLIVLVLLGILCLGVFLAHIVGVF